MITSNALGHFVHSRNTAAMLEDKEKIQALDQAMRTIGNAHQPTGRSKLKHCRATFLIPIGDGENTPLRESSDFRKYSPDHYQGYFHTDHLIPDHLIPSVFFSKERDPKELELYEDLTFRYIYDPTADPQEHCELMTGIAATWYDAKRNMDRLPEYADPEASSAFLDKTKGRLAAWLERRLKERLEA